MSDKLEAFYDHKDWFVRHLSTGGYLVGTNLKGTEKMICHYNLRKCIYSYHIRDASLQEIS